MAELETNTLHTVDIDATGEIGHFDVARDEESASVVGINLEASQSASYEVYLGFQTDSGISYFENQADETYSNVTDIADGWTQAERFLKIEVTSSASTGTTAELYVSAGTT